MSQLNNKRSRSCATLDVAVIPENIFSLRGDAFYSLVEELTSKDIEELLRIQKISNARCFLNTNPLAFFYINCADPPIVQLQNRLSIKGFDDKNIVLAGVHGCRHYLQKLFGSSLVTKKTKRINSAKSSAANSLNHQVPSTPIQTRSVAIDSSTPANISNIDHHDYLNKKMKVWWEKIRDQYNLENHVLLNLIL